MKKLILFITISLFAFSLFAERRMPIDSAKKDTIKVKPKDTVKFIPNKPIQIIQLESSSKKEKPVKGTKKESGSMMKSSSMSTMSSLSSGNDAGRTLGSLDVSGSGAATYTLPVAVPTGINGVAPQIALTYNSQGGNGIAGYGWSISGLSAITRIPRSIFHDGIIGGVNGDLNDRFALDGERLLLKSGTYGANGAEYQTENYSNIRVVSRGAIGSTGPAYFDVYYPDGSHAVYGQNTDSYTKNTYAINYIDNPRNARISYTYTKSNETLTISHIDYGALSSGSPMNQISFAYTTRSRNQQTYVNGTALFQTALLNGINVKGSGGTGYRNYVLEHDYVEALNYDRLIGVQEKSGNGSKSFDPINFGYESTVDGINPTKYVTGLWSVYPGNAIMSDFTGDGKADILSYYSNNVIYLTLDPAGGTSYSQPTQQFNVNPFDAIFTVSTLDANNRLFPGQGFTLVNQPVGGAVDIQTYLPNLSGNTIAAPTEKAWAAPQKPRVISDCLGGEDFSIPRRFFSGDFNGDGLTDIISVSRPYTYITSALSDGNGGCNITTADVDVSTVHFINLDRRITTGFANQAGTLSVIFDTTDEILTADFNGDGKTDFIHITPSNMYVYTLDASNNLQLLWSKIGGISSVTSTPPMIGDFNGDGNADILIPAGTNSSSFSLLTSKGNDFEVHSLTAPFSTHPNTTGSTTTNYYLTANDVNGDGKTDIISSVTTQTGSSTTVTATVYNNTSTSGTGEPTFTFGSTNTPSTSLTGSPLPLFFNNNETNYASEFGFFINNDIVLFRNQKDNRQEVAMSSVSQNGINMAIDYKILAPGTLSGDLPFYKSSTGASYALQTYPYIDIETQPGLRGVSQLTRTFDGHDLVKYFGYNGGVSHADGLGFLGFNETIRSNWITGTSDNNRKYTTNIYDPQKRGALVRSFLSKDPFAGNSAIKNKVGTTPDIVMNNAVTSAQTVVAANSIRLMPGFTANGNNGAFIAKLDHPVTGINDGGTTANDYITRVDYTYDTQTLTNKVFINTPKAIVTKDLLNRTNTVVTNTYDTYYNLKTQNSNFSGAGTSTVEYTYDDDPGNFIGRIRKKVETLTNGGDSFSTEIQYNNYSAFLPTEIKKKGNGTPFITENYTYDTYGNVLTKQIVTPSDGNRSTSMTYESTGRFVYTVTDVQGLVTTIAHDAVTGNVTSESAPYSRVTNYIYDAWGRPITVTNYLGKNTDTDYNRTGSGIEVVETNDEGGYTATVTNAVGKTLTVTGKDVLDQYITKTFEYDIYDRPIKESEPGSTSQWNETEYDEYGRVNEITAYTGKVTTISYNGLVTTVNDGTKTTVTTKNALGNVISTTDPGGTINNTYFANGNLKSADYGGSTQTIEQDGWGRKTKLTDPSAGTYTYTYDQFGQLKSETTPKGVTNFSYNADGTIAGKNIASGSMVYTYNYNGDKTLGSVGLTNTDGNPITYTYGYDFYKRVTSVTEDNQFALFTKTLTYDGFGRVETEKVEAKNESNNITKSKTVKNYYHNGQVNEITDYVSGNSIWKVTAANARGQVTTALLGTKLRETNSFDAYGYAQEFKTENITSTPVELMNLNYSFSAQRGNLNSRSNTAFSSTISETFSYDTQDRLTEFNDGATRIQAYDSRGRITSNSQVGNYAYTGTSYQQNGLTNLSAFAKYHYQNRTPQQINYNSFKAPITINEEGKEKIDFQYNGGLSRSHMYYGSVDADKANRPFRRHYSEDGSAEITEDIVNSKTSFIFYLGGDAYTAPAIWKYEQTGSTTNVDELFYLHRDHLGSIVMITDANANVKEKRHFDAWGNVIKVTDGSNTDLPGLTIIDRGYTGHEHLQGVGLINMNARLYDPILHRFLSPDAIIQDPSNTQNYNRYAYVLNNPLKYTDPSGNTRIERQFTEASYTDMGGGSSSINPLMFGTGRMGMGQWLDRQSAFRAEQNYQDYLRGGPLGSLEAARTGDATAVAAYGAAFGTNYFFNPIGGDEVYRNTYDKNGKHYVDIYYTGAWMESKSGRNNVGLEGGNIANWHGSGGSWDEMTKEEFHEFTLQPRPVIMLTFPDLGKALGAKGTYTVYKAITKDGGIYWGMTKNFAQRVARHGDRFSSITREYINIGSKGAARGLEQLKIDAAGGVRKLENAINSISINNPKLTQYYQDAIKYLKEL